MKCVWKGKLPLSSALARAQANVQSRWQLYEQLAGMHYAGAAMTDGDENRTEEA